MKYRIVADSSADLVTVEDRELQDGDISNIDFEGFEGCFEEICRGVRKFQLFEERIFYEKDFR